MISIIWLYVDARCKYMCAFNGFSSNVHGVTFEVLQSSLILPTAVAGHAIVVSYSIPDTGQRMSDTACHT